MAAGRPLKFKTPEDMQAAIDAYFKSCDEHIVEYEKDGKVIKLHKPEPYTMTGLAIALGFDSRQSLINYKNRTQFLDTIKNARLKVENQVERLMLTSSGVVAGIIFNAKNNFGWVDKTEQELTVKDKPKPLLAGKTTAKADKSGDAV